MKSATLLNLLTLHYATARQNSDNKIFILNYSLPMAMAP